MLALVALSSRPGPASTGINVGLLVAAIVGGVLLFGGLLAYLIVSGIRRATARTMVELQAEGILLDSGRVPMTLRFQGFRGPRVAIGVGVRSGPGRLVLTQKRLSFVPMMQNRYGFAVVMRDELGRFRVDSAEGRLHLHTTNPPNGSGTVDIMVSVASPDEWITALASAGAQR
jgi:hypothetical protein